MDIEKVRLEWKHYYCSDIIWEDEIKELTNQYELKSSLSASGRNMAITMITMVLGERIDKIEFPSNWWEAFKERFFPEFLLKRFPVDYKRYVIELHYPKLPYQKKLGGEYRTFYNKSLEPNGYPHFEDIETEEIETDER